MTQSPVLTNAPGRTYTLQSYTNSGCTTGAGALATVDSTPSNAGPFSFTYSTPVAATLFFKVTVTVTGGVSQNACSSSSVVAGESRTRRCGALGCGLAAAA